MNVCTESTLHSRHPTWFGAIFAALSARYDIPHRGGGYKSGVNHMHIDSQSLPASSRKQSPRLILALRKKELAASGRDAEDRQRQSTRCAGQWELAAMCAECFTSLRTRWGLGWKCGAPCVYVRVKYVAEGVWHRPRVGAQSHFLC